MFRSDRWLARRRQIVAAAVTGTVASILLGACADKAATAPEAPVAREVEAASSIVLKLGATLKVQVIDTAGVKLKETGWVHFISGNDTLYLRDNSAKDLDPAVGVMKVMVLKTANYKVCFGMSAHYRGDVWNSVWPKCASSTSSAGAVDMGSVYARESPMVTFIVKNQFGQVGGASFTLTVPAQAWSLTFADGNPSYDESPGSDGKIVYTLGYPNYFEWCETNLPTKHTLLSSKCGSMNAKWGQKYTFTLMHEQLLY